MSIIQGNAHTSAGGYQIERSLRFNSADSAYLNRTPASAGNRRTWTWSGWVKRSALGSTQTMFAVFDYASGGATNNQHGIRFTSSDTIEFWNYSGAYAGQKITTQVFRDVSAWYHVVAIWDTPNATASNRMRLYINGSEVTVFGTSSDPTQNTDGHINRAFLHTIGTFYDSDFGSPTNLLNGYLTEINFVDGQALTPSSFGETDSATGVWKPKAYTGTYGTNGFFLKFADNSNTTAATLGKDSSGNGNNWTPNNFSVTAGAGNDSMVDSPTSYGTDTGVGGEVRGNYCTWNPLHNKSVTLTNGNLDGSTSSGMVVGTIAVSSGKWYWECTPTDTTVQQLFGIIAVRNTSLPNYPGGSSDSYGYYATNGNKYNNSSSSSYGASYGNGDVIGVALDLDAGTLVFYKNGSSQGTAYSSLSGTFAPASGDGATNAWTANFGQRPFAYTAPSGFKALCTQNLSTPTIGATSTTQANRYFDVVLRNGFGSSGGSITSLNFQPDFWWEKARNNTYSHQWLDIIRGVGATGYSLSSNSTTAEVTQTNYLLSFNSNGYTLGTNDYSVATTLVDWCWKGGGTGVTNTAGTITSTVSASTTSGFSIVTYTGTGANATVGHGLGVAPSMVIVKNRTDGTRDWLVYHASIGNTAAVFLNLTNASTAASAYWNNTSPTSSVFSLGNSSAGNGSTNSLVAYCFAPVAGYSAFGSYTGNGSTDGPFVYTGFRPRWIMVKTSSAGTNGWQIRDTARDSYNISLGRLYADLSNAEGITSGNEFDILSNGFKVRNSGGDLNSNGGTYIYAAFAENPFKYSLAR